MISDSDLAWAGGFFDGEGSVGVYSQRAAGNRGHQLQVSVTQMNRAVLEDFRRIVGTGHLGRQRNNSWVWATSSIQGADVLAMLYPFLRTNKREQAAIALEYQAEVQASGGRRLTDGQIEMRREQAQRIKNLKRVLS